MHGDISKDAVLAAYQFAGIKHLEVQGCAGVSSDFLETFKTKLKCQI